MKTEEHKKRQMKTKRSEIKKNTGGVTRRGREEEEHGRWKRNKLQKQIGGERRGVGETVETEERSILRLSLSVRTTRLAVATRRSIDVATSVVAYAHTPTHPHTHIHALSLFPLSLTFPPPIYPSSPPVGVSVAYARVELLRSRAAGCSRHGKGGQRGPEHH